MQYDCNRRKILIKYIILNGISLITTTLVYVAINTKLNKYSGLLRQKCNLYDFHTINKLYDHQFVSIRIIFNVSMHNNRIY